MLSRLQKCFALLAPRERRRWVMLIPLSLLAATLEALGAAAVFALVKLLSDPSAGLDLSFIAPMDLGNGRTSLLTAAVVVGLFYLFKNIVLTVVTAVRNRVISASVVSVSRRMMQGYLAMPFVDHLRRNSAEVIRNSTFSVQMAFGEVMEASFSALTEIFVAAAIILVLMIKAPWLTLIAGGVLCALLGILMTSTREVLARWGRDEQALRAQLLKSIQQALHGVKEIKLRGREQFYIDVFSQRQRGVARVQYLNSTLSTASRLLIETVFIGGVLLVVVGAMLWNGPRADIVPLLGLYAYAGFRVIPSINRILLSLNRVHYGAAAVDALYDDFVGFQALPKSSDPTDGPAVAFTDRLVLTRVGFSYDGQTPALRDINLTVRRGESIGIVGPTGAGKSTLIDVILGLLQPSAGHIAVDGIDIADRVRSWQRLIGCVPQAIYLIDDTLRRNVAFGVGDDDIDDERVRAALRMAQLDDVVAGLPAGLDTVVGERGVRFSGGERQRVAIARAVYHQPELLVFDEATAALDTQTEQALTRAIESLRGAKTLLIIAHRLSTVRGCDRLLFLRNGRIEAQGSFDELLAQNPQFRVLALADRGDG